MQSRLLTRQSRGQLSESMTSVKYFVLGLVCSMVFVVCCCQLDRFRCWTVACWLGPRPKRFVPDPRWPRACSKQLITKPGKPLTGNHQRGFVWNYILYGGFQKMGLPPRSSIFFDGTFHFFTNPAIGVPPWLWKPPDGHFWLDQPSRFGAHMGPHLNELRLGCSWKSAAANRRGSSDLNFSGPAQSPSSSQELVAGNIYGGNMWKP